MTLWAVASLEEHIFWKSEWKQKVEDMNYKSEPILNPKLYHIVLSDQIFEWWQTWSQQIGSKVKWEKSE